MVIGSMGCKPTYKCDDVFPIQYGDFPPNQSWFICRGTVVLIFHVFCQNKFTFQVLPSDPFGDFK